MKKSLNIIILTVLLSASLPQQQVEAKPAGLAVCNVMINIGLMPFYAANYVIKNAAYTTYMRKTYAPLHAKEGFYRTLEQLQNDKYKLTTQEDFTCFCMRNLADAKLIRKAKVLTAEERAAQKKANANILADGTAWLLGKLDLDRNEADAVAGLANLVVRRSAAALESDVVEPRESVISEEDLPLVVEYDQYATPEQLALATVKLVNTEEPVQEGTDDVAGDRALHRAVRAGNVEAVEFLFLFGANPDLANSKGETALHIAAAYSDTAVGKELVAMLLHAGANPDLQDANGDRALHNAVRSGNMKASQLLITGVGAESCFKRFGYATFGSLCDCGGRRYARRVNAINTAGETAYTLAGDNQEMRDMLEYYGARA